MAETMDPSAEASAVGGRYVAEIVTCHKCAARNRAERTFGETAIPASWDGARSVVHDQWEDGQPPRR